MRGHAPMPESGPLANRTVQMGFLALLLGLWFLATNVAHVHRLLLPDPASVGREMQALVVSGALWNAARVTFATVAKAYVSAALLGLLIGFSISRSTRSVRLLEPILSGLFAIPLTLFFPLFILFFGIGTNSKLAYGGVYSLLPIAIASIAAFARVDPLMVCAARSMGAGGWTLLRRVYLPGALPGILNGMRIGLVICIAAVLGGETLSSTEGVGYAIKTAGELMDAPRLYAWIVFVALASFLLNLLLSAVENWNLKT